MKQQYLLSIILISLFTLITSACSTELKHSSVGNYDELLTNIYHNGDFIFLDLPWFITMQEVMDSKNLNENHVLPEHGDYLIETGDSFAIESNSLNQNIIYIFTDDQLDGQLISGEYLFTSEDKGLLAVFASELKTHLLDSLPEPYANDLSILDNVNNLSDSTKSISWEGTDGSLLTISIGVLQGDVQKGEFLVKIKSSASKNK